MSSNRTEKKKVFLDTRENSGENYFLYEAMNQNKFTLCTEFLHNQCIISRHGDRDKSIINVFTILLPETPAFVYLSHFITYLW